MEIASQDLEQRDISSCLSEFKIYTGRMVMSKQSLFFNYPLVLTNNAKSKAKYKVAFRFLLEIAHLLIGTVREKMSV